MKEIYSSAKCTIAWLGPPADGSDLFLERCNRIGGGLVRRQISDGSNTCSFSDLVIESVLLPWDSEEEQERHKSLAQMIMHELTHYFEEALQDIPGTVAFSAACNRFLNRAYWTRVWIWQEFVVSHNIVLQCGYSKIGFPELNDSLYFLFRFEPILMKKLKDKQSEILEKSSPNITEKILEWLADQCPDSNNDADLIEYKTTKKDFDALAGLVNTPSTKIFSTRRAYQRPQKQDSKDRLTLIRILEAAFVDGRAAATNARDCVFAMLGFAKDTEQLGLLADYNESVSDVQVYTQTAYAIIAAGHVDLLALSQHRPDSNKRREERIAIPSWVPDWTHPITRPSGQVPWETMFAASGKNKVENPQNFEMSSFGHLQLFGWVVDEIEETSPAWMCPDDSLNNNRHNIKKYLEDIRELCNKSDTKYSSTDYDIYAPGAFDRLSAHFIVPVADQEMNSLGLKSRASSSCQQAYVGLLDAVSAITTLRLESSFYLEMMRYQRFRRPFLSNSGFVGLAPDTSEKGDVLVIFSGAKFPYVLRHVSDDNYAFLGEAYTHGIMYGEFMKGAGKEKKFVLQ